MGPVSFDCSRRRRYGLQPERFSYPAAENPELVLGTLQFLKLSAIPLFLSDKLTRKLSDHFPIVYDIRSRYHLTSDHFRLLRMMRLLETEKRATSWYTDEFVSKMKRLTSFPSEALAKELERLLKLTNPGQEFDTHVPSKEALQLLEYMDKDEREFRVRYFSRFFHLDPPYFRYAIQNRNSLDLQRKTRDDLERMIFAICKRRFNRFALDDVRRIVGWSVYFGILHAHATDDVLVYSLRRESVVQYVIELLVRFVNDRFRSRPDQIWRDLREDLVANFVFGDSFLSVEGLVETLLDQNRERHRWTFLERGTGRYPGFRKDASKQMLRIDNLPLSYEFSPKDVAKMISL